MARKNWEGRCPLPLGKGVKVVSINGKVSIIALKLGGEPESANQRQRAALTDPAVVLR